MRAERPFCVQSGDLRQKCGNEKDAPIPAIGERAIEHRDSTRRRHSTDARINIATEICGNGNSN